MRLLLSALVLVSAAQAGIVEGDKKTAPLKGIAVPKGHAPTHLECWVDGRREVVQVAPAQLPPNNMDASTQVVIRGSDGTSTVVVVPRAGASGCLPLR
ncbi:MAG: hypothetical protein H7Z12_04530 [Rhodospirillaceae bacterium]|nr:hypothetical protein [Rhodospirillales bacterium]